MMAANTHTKGQVWLDRPTMISGLRVTVVIWMAVALSGWAAAWAAYSHTLSAQQSAARMASIAGLTPVSGPGVEVVLSDSTRALAPGDSPSELLVQDSDLVFLEMALWYGGAEAVAVNGVRITAKTSIVSAGPTIVVDGHRLVGPFHITAVGDPRLLRGVLMTREGYAARLREFGLNLQIVDRPHLTVPAAAMGSSTQL
ncbi:MAG TPA: DUF881 domain-containing protein [bacterium]|nr:DUF881 domain-containing protein [bacterium]